MFKKLPISLAAMTFTAGMKLSIDNSQLSIPACNTDKGCLTETASPWKLQKDTDKQPKDYVVPNFGVDRDIIATKSNLKNAETSLKTQWVIPALAQQKSIPACNTDKGCSTETASPWKLQKDTDKQPKDYVVPNFGVDRDILATKSNLKNAETSLKTQWVIPALAQQKSIPACNTDKGCLTETASPWKLQKDTDKQPKDYVVPNFGVDRDIIATKSNLKNAETSLKSKWVIPALAQVSDLSIPACNSADFPGCVKDATTVAPTKKYTDNAWVTDDNERPNLNNPKIERKIFTQKGKKDDMHCNSVECPLGKSYGRAYDSVYDYNEHFHRLENPPKPKEASNLMLSQPEYKFGVWVLPQNLVETESIPACNTDKGCSLETASPWKMGGDPEIVDYSSGYEWRVSTKVGEKWLKESNAETKNADEKPKEGAAAAEGDKKAKKPAAAEEAAKEADKAAEKEANKAEPAAEEKK